MNLKYINNFFLLFLSFYLFSCDSIKNFNKEDQESFFYDDILEKDIDIEELNFDNISKSYDDYYTKNSNLNWNSKNKFNKLNSIKFYKNKEIEKKIYLSVYSQNQFITINEKSQLRIYDLISFDLTNEFSILDHENLNFGYPISLAHLNNNYFINYSNGFIISFNLDGSINWKINFNDLIKTPIKIFNDNIILLTSNKIISINYLTGNINWEFTYEGDNILQYSGGDIVDINNILYFILPNKAVGEVDAIFGEKKYSTFTQTKLKTLINNSDDKLYSYKNFLIYFDQKKYLYTIDTANNNFILNSEKIKNVHSFIFYKNALITFNNDGLLKAYNILNKKLFWEISINEIIDLDDIIVDIISNNNLALIFFKSGKYIEVNLSNGNIIHNDKLGIKNITNIRILDGLIITTQENNIYTFYSQ